MAEVTTLAPFYYYGGVQVVGRGQYTSYERSSLFCTRIFWWLRYTRSKHPSLLFFFSLSFLFFFLFHFLLLFFFFLFVFPVQSVPVSPPLLPPLRPSPPSYCRVRKDSIGRNPMIIRMRSFRDAWMSTETARKEMHLLASVCALILICGSVWRRAHESTGGTSTTPPKNVYFFELCTIHLYIVDTLHR